MNWISFVFFFVFFLFCFVCLYFFLRNAHNLICNDWSTETDQCHQFQKFHTAMHAERDRGFEIECKVQTCVVYCRQKFHSTNILIIFPFSPWDQIPWLPMKCQSYLSTEWRTGLLTSSHVSILVSCVMFTLLLRCG